MAHVSSADGTPSFVCFIFCFSQGCEAIEWVGCVILQALMPRKFDLLGQEIFEQHHYLKGGLPTAMWGLLVRDEQMFLVNISPADIC